MENLLSSLLYLACPVGLGLMMWLMMRGQRGHSAPAPVSGTAQSPTERLGQLRTELSEVQARQTLIAERISRLSAEDRPAVSERWVSRLPKPSARARGGDVPRGSTP